MFSVKFLDGYIRGALPSAPPVFWHLSELVTPCPWLWLSSVVPPVRFFASRDDFFLDFDRDISVQCVIFAGCDNILVSISVAITFAFW